MRVVRGRLGQLQMLKEAQRIVPPAILIVGDVAAMGTSSVMAAAGLPAAAPAQTPAICAKQVS